MVRTENVLANQPTQARCKKAIEWGYSNNDGVASAKLVSQDLNPHLGNLIMCLESTWSVHTARAEVPALGHGYPVLVAFFLFYAC